MDPVRQLGEILERAGFGRDGLMAMFGELDRVKAKVLRQAGVLELGGELAPLADLFYLGVPVDEGPAREALAPVSPEELVPAGLLERSGEGFSSPARITPWLGLNLAHDPWETGSVAPDYVAGGNPSAETLARATIRPEVASTLDLGSGGGSQTVLAARHSERVVAVDLNPRALFYTDVNARLNGFENVECRQGDFFEPVEGERFELVVANPPYIISPDQQFLFRDSDDEEGGVSRRIVRRIPALLEEGAFGHVLCNWASHPGQNSWEPLGEWTEGLGCDVCVLNWGAEPLVHYASRWTEPFAAMEESAYVETVGRWLDYYRRSEIDTIWFGEVILRRRSTGPNWFRGFDVRQQTEGFGGDQLERLFAAQDFLNDPKTGSLLDEVFAPAPGLIVRHVLSYAGTDYDVDGIEVALTEGIGLRGQLQPLVLHVFMLLDGVRPLSELVDEAAQAHDTGPELLADLTLETMRRLFEEGFVVRVERG